MFSSSRFVEQNDTQIFSNSGLLFCVVLSRTLLRESVGLGESEDGKRVLFDQKNQ